MVLPTSSSGSTTLNDQSLPPSSGRKLVLCFDGTGDLFDTTNTNIVKLVSFLKKDDYRNQMVYYQTGVGTAVKAGLFSGLAKMAAYGVGWDIKYHIMGGYTFLMQNWVPGDRIYLFGFSRGAYTARALAGMLHKVGLLPRGNDEQVPFAYSMYMRTDKAGWEASTSFKGTFSNTVSIDFVGVWETVESVGIFRNVSFPFTASGNHIRIFRHALSLDERRVKFKANHYHANLNLSQLSKAAAEADAVAGLEDTDMQEVWFSGGHGEIGGGNFSNEELYDPARIPMAWMLREIVLTDTGLEFDLDAVKKADFVLPERPEGGRVTNGKAAHEERPILPIHCIRNLDKRYDGDVKAKITDQLLISPSWWFLELIPFSYMHHGPNGSITYTHVPNLGKARSVPTLPPKATVHVSVRERMKLENTYQPKAKWQGEPVWAE
ncbi:hypothetical protein DACRYDRAFT_108354 [Dacryopinax primogenitus]|uniref:T6SS Phospholipase effector Tle1-like catalytic domain-containing protein n=1 Tax=Dacryopinax primogenitus (strain DJM 731) TaxID=1858805 RepID=M5FTP3_DACPD|nr:uncharacterized protein DACRYDRAFT_108354 [Dacryopinax primogenitus]EJU01021.1 hypothetical protein DACRYDRAFT_108354 [Dacryopinax primogenitus]